MGNIRTAIDKLSNMEGFSAGLDTDKLSRGCRDYALKYGGHFAKLGQDMAAILWFSSVQAKIISEN